MRNRALHDNLLVFAERASDRLTELVEAGAELPFEVAESPGATSVLYRYRPLTGQFLREQLGELRRLEGFGSLLLSLGKLEGASAYLRVLGLSHVPATEGDRGEAVLVEFLARLWEDATAFELDHQRFERVYHELEGAVFDDTVVATVLAPMLGLRLNADERLELGGGVALARGDLCEAPAEAVWELGPERTEPNALVALSVELMPGDPPPLTLARMEFRKLLTALRLFKAGSATLGPVAWWRLEDGPWQSLALGFAGRPRSGEYWLEALERDELAELYELVRQRPVVAGPVSWALARFEMGCEQPMALEGLSDHLLALRALLDGDEVSPVGVSSRLAALCAEPAEREELKTRIEEAFALQRRLMRGDLDSDPLDLDALDTAHPEAPDGVARDLEEHLRALLRDVVCGYLEGDVKRTADELLRLEAESRPAPPSTTPEPRRRAKQRALPVLESWDDVVAEPEEEPPADEPPEPEFVVRRNRPPRARKPAKAQGRKRAAPRKAAEDDHEQETRETVAVGAFPEDAVEGESTDWGFDDDPADYSAAV